MNGALGRPAWQWLYIIEGCAGILVGILCWILLPPAPDQIKNNKHWIFSEAEINLAITRMKTYNVEGARVRPKQIWIAAKDPKTIAFAFINAGVSLALSSISAFLPTFIAQFGYSNSKLQTRYHSLSFALLILSS
jgi:hypothetical protein